MFVIFFLEGDFFYFFLSFSLFFPPHLFLPYLCKKISFKKNLSFILMQISYFYAICTRLLYSFSFPPQLGVQIF